MKPMDNRIVRDFELRNRSLSRLGFRLISLDEMNQRKEDISVEIGVLKNISNQNSLKFGEVLVAYNESDDSYVTLYDRMSQKFNYLMIKYDVSRESFDEVIETLMKEDKLKKRSETINKVLNNGRA